MEEAGGTYISCVFLFFWSACPLTRFVFFFFVRRGGRPVFFFCRFWLVALASWCGFMAWAGREGVLGGEHEGQSGKGKRVGGLDTG